MSPPPSQQPLCLVRSSINIDEMFAVPHVVRPGETISSSSLTSRPGGKGANISAAVALAEQKIVLSGAVGKDASWPIDELKKRGVDTSKIRILEGVPTGRAFIQVAEDGENSIVLLKGANYHPDPEESDDPRKVFSSLPSPPTHLIVQNEIMLQITKDFLAHAHSSDLSTPCMTIFNPSPMPSKSELQSFNWKDVDVLIVNEGEGQDLLEAMGSSSSSKGEGKGEEDVLNALDSLDQLQHTSWIVMTKGAKGVIARVRQNQEKQTNSKRQHFDIPPAKPKKVVDTTGAGDTFAGNLVAGLMRSSSSSNATSPQEILQYAALAAAMAVETNGAMESIPRQQDVAARQRESS